MAAFPRDLKILYAIIFARSMLGGLMAPFVAQKFNPDLATAAWFSSLYNLSGLCGSFFLSRCSDKLSRRTMLMVSLAGSWGSCALGWFFPDSIIGVLCAGFANAGFDSIASALIADNCVSMGASVAEVSSMIGKVNLLIAVATVVSPMLGAQVASSYRDVQLIALVWTAAVAPFILLLSKTETKAKETVAKPWTMRDFMDLKVARTAAGLWYLGWLFLAVGIFHVCQTVLTPSLTDRFAIDAAMHGQLQMAIGAGSLVGTIASGPIAERFCRPHPTSLISNFLAVTFMTRLVMFTTTSFPTYLGAMFVFGFMGIGVISPVVSSMPSQFVPEDELGGYMGLKTAVESTSGIVGPAMAGLLGVSLTMSPLNLTLLLLYALVPLYSKIGYPAFMQPAVELMAHARNGKPDKRE